MDDTKRRSSDSTFFTVSEAAASLGVSTVTVYRWINDERIETVDNPLSDRTVISFTEVERIRPFVRSRS